ncbi:hypothetical protein T4B_12504 [Trichinella pseudospiralis]|uniref:Uncharacterized protein n=1 Tax=Trichinella pseudospiralis TaxID=6337 RepID=A0A0V1E7M4_TRIPS|nr:hypothetical protein T4A_11574 [Trichinella pseudospiralis]KRZ10288.1 hypothetical protein T4B_12504 [Trichinella pseudospiralis]KRZ25440.1 hypothetical protein T4C_1839 [Trichinella pseudospiralis]
MKDAENKKTDEKTPVMTRTVSAFNQSRNVQKRIVEEISMKRTWMNDKPCVIKASCVPHICEKVPEIRR